MKRFTGRSGSRTAEAERARGPAPRADGICPHPTQVGGRKGPVSRLEDGRAERGDPPFLGLFTLFRPSTSWVRPTYVRQGICFTPSLTSHANLTQEHPLDTPSAGFNQTSGPPGQWLSLLHTGVTITPPPQEVSLVILLHFAPSEGGVAPRRVSGLQAGI